MPRRFALDQNFPEPIVDGLADWLAQDAELVPIRRIDAGMATLDDWQVLLALHSDELIWDGLITTDANMLSLPRELAVLCQTKLTLVVAEAVGHDPIKATGLVLAHIGRICEQTRSDIAQVWRLRTSTRPAEDPWDFLTRLGKRKGTSAQALYASERLSNKQLHTHDWTDDVVERLLGELRPPSSEDDTMVHQILKELQ